MQTRCDEHDLQPIFPSGGFITMNESQLHEHCVTPFKGSISRPLLFANLIQWLSQLRSIGIHGELWIDGSYLTMKPEPNDVDVLLLIDVDKTTLEEHNIENANFLLDRNAIKQRYRVEVYTVKKGHDIENESYWRGWFGFCRDTRTPKGVAEVIV